MFKLELEMSKVTKWESTKQFFGVLMQILFAVFCIFYFMLMVHGIVKHTGWLLVASVVMAIVYIPMCVINVLNMVYKISSLITRLTKRVFWFKNETEVLDLLTKGRYEKPDNPFTKKEQWLLHVLRKYTDYRVYNVLRRKESSLVWNISEQKQNELGKVIDG